MAQSVGQWLLSTSRGGLESSAVNAGTTTSTLRWRSLHGLRKRIESSTRPTNGLATAGQRSPSFFLDGNTILSAQHCVSPFPVWVMKQIKCQADPQQDRQLHQEPLELHHEEEGGAWGVPARWLQEFHLFSRWSEETPPQTVSSSSSRAPALWSQSPAYTRTQSGPLPFWTQHNMVFWFLYVDLFVILKCDPLYFRWGDILMILTVDTWWTVFPKIQASYQWVFVNFFAC